MNTTQCNKLDKLLNFGIPKKDQKPRAYLGNVEFINMDRTLMVRTSDGVEDATIHAFMAHEEADQLNTKVFDNAKFYVMSAYSRKELITILEGMDSDVVTIKMDYDSPILIEGRQGEGEVKVEAILAPRIYDNDEVEFYVY